MSVLSIITVVRNDAAGLGRTAQSLTKQTSAPHEWIIVDGASTDGTATLARELESSRMARVVSESDRGLYDAMNKGVSLATGSFVLFLNAGDSLLNPTTVAELDEAIACQSVPEHQTTVIYGRFYMQLGDTLRKGRVSEPAYISYGLPTSHQAMLFPRRWLAAHPFDLSYQICGDYWIVAKAYAEGLRFARTGVPICVFEAGGMSFQHPTRIWRESARIQRRVLGLNMPMIARSTVRRVVNYAAYAILYLIRTRTALGRVAVHRTRASLPDDTVPQRTAEPIAETISYPPPDPHETRFY